MNAWFEQYGRRALLALVFLPVIFTRWLPQVGNPGRPPFPSNGPNPWVDVTAFGANPNCAPASISTCAVDSTLAIQAAINATPQGGTVYFPQGASGNCYMISSRLKLTAFISYTGPSLYTAYQGACLILKNGSNDYMAVSNDWQTNSTTVGNPLSITFLEFNGNKANNASGLDCIRLMNWRSVVYENYLHDCQGNGLTLSDQNQAGGQISNSEVENQVTFNHIQNNGGFGFENAIGTGKGTDGWFVGNVLSTNGSDGAIWNEAGGWQITYNHPYANNGNGLNVTGMFKTTIINNYLELSCAAACAGGFPSGIVANLKSGGTSQSVISGNTVSLTASASNTMIGITLGTAGVNSPFVAVGNAVQIIAGAGTTWGMNINGAGTLSGPITGNSLPGMTVAINNSTQGNLFIRDNKGFNPQATSGVTAGASPFTYTNADNFPETMLCTSNCANVSALTYRGNVIPATTFNDQFYLSPGDSMIITWATTAPVYLKSPQ